MDEDGSSSRSSTPAPGGVGSQHGGASSGLSFGIESADRAASRSLSRGSSSPRKRALDESAGGSEEVGMDVLDYQQFLAQEEEDERRRELEETLPPLGPEHDRFVEREIRLEGGTGQQVDPDHGLQFVDAVAGSGDLSRGGTNNDQQRQDALSAHRFGVRGGGASAAYQGPPLAHNLTLAKYQLALHCSLSLSKITNILVGY